MGRLLPLFLSCEQAAITSRLTGSDLRRSVGRTHQKFGYWKRYSLEVGNCDSGKIHNSASKAGVGVARPRAYTGFQIDGPLMIIDEQSLHTCYVEGNTVTCDYLYCSYTETFTDSDDAEFAADIHEYSNRFPAAA